MLDPLLVPHVHPRCRFGHFLGAVLVEVIGWEYSLLILIGICALFIPVGYIYMDR